MKARPVTRHLRRLLLLLAALMLSPWAGAQVLETVNGIVELREAADQPWRPASAAEVLEIGSSLRSLQGNARVQLGQNNFLQLDHASALTRLETGYAELQGKLYGRATDLRLDIGLPDLRLLGEGRVDVLENGAHRIAMFSGEALAWLKNDLVIVRPGEQLYVPTNGEPPILSAYFERDPWYRNLLSLSSGTGKVEAAYGTNEIRLPGEDWRVANPGTPFVEGAHARTHAGAWLEIRFDDGNLIRLQADSEIRLVKLDEYENGSRHTVLELLSGSVWAVVVNEGQPFEIETPGLVAGVRGTKFRLDAPAGDRPPRLKVFEGLVIGITETRGVPVSPGETFVPDRGVETSDHDEVDDFNLTLDVVVPDADGTKPDAPPPPVAPPSSGEPAPDDASRQEPEMDSPCAGQSEGRGQGQGNNCRDSRHDPPEHVAAPSDAATSPREEGRATEPEDSGSGASCAGQSEGRGNGRGNNCGDHRDDSGDTDAPAGSSGAPDDAQDPAEPPRSGVSEPEQPGTGGTGNDGALDDHPGRGEPGAGKGERGRGEPPSDPPGKGPPSDGPPGQDKKEPDTPGETPGEGAPPEDGADAPPSEPECPGNSQGRGQGRGNSCPEDDEAPPPADDVPPEPCRGQGKGGGQGCQGKRGRAYLFSHPLVLSSVLSELRLRPLPPAGI